MKKSNPIMRAALKLLISSIAVFIIFYVTLPPLNPLSSEFWTFLTAVLAIYLLPFCFTNLFTVYTLPGSAARIELARGKKSTASKRCFFTPKIASTSERNTADGKIPVGCRLSG